MNTTQLTARGGLPSYLFDNDWGYLNKYLRAWANAKPWYEKDQDDPRFQSPYGFDESSESWRLEHGLPGRITYSEQQYADDAKKQMQEILGGIIPEFFNRVGWTKQQRKEADARNKWGYLFGDNSSGGGTSGNTGQGGNYSNYYANYGSDNFFNPHPGMNFLWRDSSGMLHDYGDNPQGNYNLGPPPIADNFPGLQNSNAANNMSLLQNGMAFLENQRNQERLNNPYYKPVFGNNSLRRPNPITPLPPQSSFTQPANPPVGTSPVGSPPGTNAPPYGFGGRRYGTQPIAPMRKAYKTSFY